MSETVRAHVDRPISAVKVITAQGAVTIPGSTCEIQDSTFREATSVDLEAKEAAEAAFLQACRSLQELISKLDQFCRSLFSQHADEIAKLSVEIARKILVQKVRDGDYEIERIVQQALQNAPAHVDVVVHLNPADLAQCQRAQQDEAARLFAGIKFVPDPSVGRAECVLENPKGIIKSLIDEHLQRVAQALKKAE